MKSHLTRIVTVAVLLFAVLVGGGWAQTQQYVFPVELYRFAKPGAEGGYLLTPYYSEGVAANWLFQGTAGFIYVPQLSGFPNIPSPTPVNPGLLPVHRWQVIESGRPYFFYSLVFRETGPGYTYQGIIGYMYSGSQDFATVPGSGQFPLYKVKSCFSSTQGYFHAKLWPVNPSSNPLIYQLESPPNSTFNCGPEHELIGGGIFTGRGTNPNAPVPVPETSMGDYSESDKAPGELFSFGSN